MFIVLQLGFPGPWYSRVYRAYLQKYVNALNSGKFLFSFLKFLLWAFEEGQKAVELCSVDYEKKRFLNVQLIGRCFPFEQDVIGQIHSVEGMYLNHFGLQTEIGLGLFCGGFKLFFLLKTFIFY